MNFIESVLAGLSLETDIENFVEEWHNSDSSQDLHDYLGMTSDEYALWVEQPLSINYILNSRRFKKPLKFQINDSIHLIAARSLAIRDKELLKDWLVKEGYF